MTSNVAQLNPGFSSDGSNDGQGAHDGAGRSTIEQVRELIYGDALRHHERGLEGLGGSLRDLEQRVFARIQDMENDIHSLCKALRMEQARNTRAIGEAIVALGHQVMELGQPRDQRADQ